VDLASPLRPHTRQSSYLDPRPMPSAHVAMASPKRKGFSSFPEDGGRHVNQEAKRPRPVYYGNEVAPHPPSDQLMRVVDASRLQPLEARRPVAQPPQPVIDLTSSPRRPIYRENGYHLPAYSDAAAESNGLSYVPVSSRRSAPREARRATYEVHPGESPRDYMPSSGMYERRAQPVRDYLPVREEQQRLIDDDRHIRNPLHYGGPKQH
jgi:hypothetical protein